MEIQQRVMDVNFFGAVRVVQAFLPLLRASHGTIVFQTALMAHTVLPFNAGYAASKCALERLGGQPAARGPPARSPGCHDRSGLPRHRPGEQAEPDDDVVYPIEIGFQEAMSRVQDRIFAAVLPRLARIRVPH